ncbi:25668_t:CDS:2, partial [Racocetra persica]
ETFHEDFQEENFQEVSHQENFQEESYQNFQENPQIFTFKKLARWLIADLKKYLALNCLNQDKDIIEFYVQVVANRQGYSQVLPQEIIFSSNLSKRKCKIISSQTLLSKFLE